MRSDIFIAGTRQMEQILKDMGISAQYSEVFRRKKITALTFINIINSQGKQFEMRESLAKELGLSHSQILVIVDRVSDMMRKDKLLAKEAITAVRQPLPTSSAGSKQTNHQVPASLVQSAFSKSQSRMSKLLMQPPKAAAKPPTAVPALGPVLQMAGIKTIEQSPQTINPRFRDTTADSPNETSPSEEQPTMPTQFTTQVLPRAIDMVESPVVMEESPKEEVELPIRAINEEEKKDEKLEEIAIQVLDVVVADQIPQAIEIEDKLIPMTESPIKETFSEVLVEAQTIDQPRPHTIEEPIHQMIEKPRPEPIEEQQLLVEQVEIDGSITEEDDDFDILDVNFIQTNTLLPAKESLEINIQEEESEPSDQSESSSDQPAPSSSSESEDVEMKFPCHPVEVPTQQLQPLAIESQEHTESEDDEMLELESSHSQSGHVNPDDLQNLSVIKIMEETKVKQEEPEPKVAHAPKQAKIYVDTEVQCDPWPFSTRELVDSGAQTTRILQKNKKFSVTEDKILKETGYQPQPESGPRDTPPSKASFDLWGSGRSHTEQTASPTDNNSKRIQANVMIVPGSKNVPPTPPRQHSPIAYQEPPTSLSQLLQSQTSLDKESMRNGSQSPLRPILKTKRGRDESPTPSQITKRVKFDAEVIKRNEAKLSSNNVMSHKEYIREMMRRKKAAKQQEVNEYYEEESDEEEDEEGGPEVFHNTDDRPDKRRSNSSPEPSSSEDSDDASPEEGRHSWVAELKQWISRKK